MEFDTSVEISTNHNYLLQSTQKNKRPTKVLKTEAISISDAKKNIEYCYDFYSWMFALAIVLVTRRFLSFYYSLLREKIASPFDAFQALQSSSSSSCIRRRLSNALSLQLSSRFLLDVFVVNPYVLKISSTLSTAQTSRLSNHSNAKTISTTTNKKNIIIQRRSEERKEEEKTLVKSTTIIATQNSNNNIFAESLPSEVESQAATTAAVVAVVDCSSYNFSKVIICQKVFEIGRDFLTSDFCECSLTHQVVDI